MYYIYVYIFSDTQCKHVKQRQKIQHLRELIHFVRNNTKNDNLLNILRNISSNIGAIGARIETSHNNKYNKFHKEAIKNLSNLSFVSIKDAIIIDHYSLYQMQYEPQNHYMNSPALKKRKLSNGKQCTMTHFYTLSKIYNH